MRQEISTAAAKQLFLSAKDVAWKSVSTVREKILRV